MSEYDFIICGGGLAGCVVASRLKEAFPDLAIALIETGSDSRSDEIILDPGRAWLIGEDRYHNYTSTPQTGAAGRTLPLKCGRALGGGSAVNYGGFTRGDRNGYDEWANLVGDDRWSYDGILPFFKKSETYPLRGRDEQHGYAGPLKPSKGNRGYPLKDDVKDAIVSAGFRSHDDGNGGDFMGCVPLVESWDGKRRTFAANEYDLSGVDVLVEKHVHKVLFDDAKRATGVQLADGSVLHARKEVILSCGSIRTPQVLQLSGVGPKDDLARLQIPVIVDSSQVGKNLHDHLMCSLWFKLRNPEEGLAVGSEKFMSKPEFLGGNPMDWLANATAPEAAKQQAAELDGTSVSKRRDDIELTFMYVATPTSAYPPPPIDGTAITMGIVLLSTTSRGSVTLTSADPKDNPVVDPAYLQTAHDRAVMREATRLALKIANTPVWQKLSKGEIPPGPFASLTLGSSDEELNERIAETCVTCYHYAGTASMGSVVDTDCRVKGVQKLRVVDASILPVSISAHLQAPMYGIAERAAQIIIDSYNSK